MAGRRDRVDAPATGAVTVALDSCHPNPWNPNRMDGLTYAKTIESIRKYGFIDPMTVRALPGKPGEWQIIDGENRWRAARDLGIESGPAFSLGNVEEKMAMQLTIVLNELRGQYDPRSMGSLLRTLLDNETIDELTRTLPFTEESLRGLIGLQDFDWGTLGKQQESAPSAERSRERWVERTFRLEVAANGVLQQALDKAKEEADGEMSDAQALELISADYIAS